MEQSRLSRLPPELRNTIYELALSSDGEVHLRQATKHSPNANYYADLSAALTRTCRAVRAETIGIFRTFNRFRFHLCQLDLPTGSGDALRKSYLLRGRLHRIAAWFSDRDATRSSGSAPNKHVTLDLGTLGPYDSDLTHLNNTMVTLRESVNTWDKSFKRCLRVRFTYMWAWEIPVVFETPVIREADVRQACNVVKDEIHEQLEEGAETAKLLMDIDMITDVLCRGALSGRKAQFAF